MQIINGNNPFQQLSVEQLTQYGISEGGFALSFYPTMEKY